MFKKVIVLGILLSLSLPAYSKQLVITDTVNVSQDTREALTKKYEQLSSKRSQLTNFGKELTNYFVPYQGFGPSSEIGDVLLDEKIKVKHKLSAGLVMEKLADQDMIQLSPLAMKIEQLTSLAVANDPVVSGLKSQIHKYNVHRNSYRAMGHIVNTLFGVVARGPSCFGISAGGEAALVVFAAATGGPEQHKIKNQVYLYKMIESRSNLLKDIVVVGLWDYCNGNKVNGKNLLDSLTGTDTQSILEN